MIIINSIIWGGNESWRDIPWDNNENISERSWNINVWWDNHAKLETRSGNIKISWNNDAILNTRSGEIKIKRDNDWSLSTRSGSVSVWKNNSWDAETRSWSIDVDWDNSWDLKSRSWDILVAWVSSWNLKTESWSIKVQENKWILNSKSWKINIVNKWLEIIREWWTAGSIVISNWSNDVFTNISWNTIISWSSIISWWTIHIWDWDMTINWQSVSDMKTSGWKMPNKVVINGNDTSVVFDFEKNQVTQKWQVIESDWNGRYNVPWFKVSSSDWRFKAVYWDQTIIASETDVTVKFID